MSMAHIATKGYTDAKSGPLPVAMLLSEGSVTGGVMPI